MYPSGGKAVGVYVPNYVPEPEEIPGNLTKEPYARRVQYIRHVLYKFIGSVAMIVGVGLLVPRNLPVWPITGFMLIVLLLVSGIRTVLRGTNLEPKLTTWCLPIVVVAVAVTSRAWTAAAFPAWSILAGIACFGIYATICGRDFSFVGGYALSIIASSVFIAGVMVEEGMSSQRSTEALLWNAFGLFYLVYDLAAMLSRRKRNESWASVVDLYRDIFNFVGYFPRVVIHWNRHRILNDLNIENPFRS